jgi:hypothetical protein
VTRYEENGPFGPSTDEFVKKFKRPTADEQIAAFRAKQEKFETEFDQEFDQMNKFLSPRFFRGWFLFVAFVAVAMLVGSVAVAIILWPHLMGLLDRLGK